MGYERTVLLLLREEPRVKSHVFNVSRINHGVIMNVLEKSDRVFCSEYICILYHGGVNK